MHTVLLLSARANFYTHSLLGGAAEAVTFVSYALNCWKLYRLIDMCIILSWGKVQTIRTVGNVVTAWIKKLAGLVIYKEELRLYTT